MVGEVAIQIDAVGVAARGRRDPVGIEIGDDPQVDATQRARARERAGHGDADRLVAVDAADDEGVPRDARPAQFNRFDRPAAHRAAEDDPARRGRGRERAGVGDDTGDHDREDGERRSARTHAGDCCASRVNGS